MNPALCRVLAYWVPGLPRPTISFMLPLLTFRKDCFTAETQRDAEKTRLELRSESSLRICGELELAVETRRLLLLLASLRGGGRGAGGRLRASGGGRTGGGLGAGGGGSALGARGGLGARGRG